MNTLAGTVLGIRLFLSSFVPLFAIFAIRFEDKALQLATGGLAFFGTVTLVLLMRRAKRISPEPHRVTSVADRGAEVAGYVATYLLPFVTVAEPTARDVAGYTLFLVVIGVVYVRSGMIQINPLLYLFRYRIWEITTDDAWRGYLIGRSYPRAGSHLTASSLSNSVLVEQTNDEGVDPEPPDIS